MDALERLHRDGLTVAVVDGRLIVGPKERITADHRQLVKDHKQALLLRLTPASTDDTDIPAYQRALDQARAGLDVTLSQLIAAGGHELASDWAEPYQPHRTPEFLRAFAMAVATRLNLRGEGGAAQ